MQWSSGVFGMPDSFKELWQDEGPVQENVFSSPSYAQTRALSPNMSANQGLNNFLSQSNQPIGLTQTTSEGIIGNGSSAVQAKVRSSNNKSP